MSEHACLKETILGTTVAPHNNALKTDVPLSASVRPRKPAASTYSHEEQHDDQFHTYLPLVP
jgi:hypothetical protein